MEDNRLPSADEDGTVEMFADRYNASIWQSAESKMIDSLNRILEGDSIKEVY